MIDRRLQIALIFLLAAATVEDTLLFCIAWFKPELWFSVFHHHAPLDLDIAWLRRSTGQWLAFALGQAITLALWRRQPVWLAIAAGLRISDLFTDISYVISSPPLATAGYLCLLPPPLLNAIVIAVLLLVWQKATGAKQS